MSFRTVKALGRLTILRKMKYGCNTVLLQVSRAFAVRSSPNMCWPIIGRCKFQGGLVEMWVTRWWSQPCSQAILTSNRWWWLSVARYGGDRPGRFGIYFFPPHTHPQWVTHRHDCISCSLGTRLLGKRGSGRFAGAEVHQAECIICGHLTSGTFTHLWLNKSSAVFQQLLSLQQIPRLLELY